MNDYNFGIYCFITDIIYFIICLIYICICIKKKDKERFITAFMGIICTPVGFLFISGLLFVLLLILLFEIIPNLIIRKQ